MNVGQMPDKALEVGGSARCYKFSESRCKYWVADSDMSIITIGFITKKITKKTSGKGNGQDRGPIAVVVRKSLTVRDYAAGRVRRLSPTFLPRYLAVRGRHHERLIAVPMQLADMFFVGLGPAAPYGPLSVDLYGTSFRGFSVYTGSGTSAYYVMFDNNVVGITRDAMCEFTFALSEIHDYNLAKCAAVTTLTWPRPLSLSDRLVATAASKLYTAIGVRGDALPVSKVSAHHHVHYRPSEVSAAARQARVLECNLLIMLLRVSDMHCAAFGGFMCWFNALSDTMLIVVSAFECWQCKDLASLAKSLKNTVRVAKLLQNNVSVDMLPIFEAEVLVNRGIGDIDWLTESKNRRDPDVTDMPYSLVYQRAMNILQKGKHDRGRYQTMDWEQYWHTRWQFTPTGSAKSQHAEDLADLPEDFRLRNKFVALNTTDINTFDEWVQRKPAIHAWSSYKYEWGKQRAIYGCDMTNFVLTNFVMFRCEDRLPPKFPVGSRAEPQYVSRALEAVLEGAEPFCFDFEDFNSQHSTSSMVAVLAAYRDTYWPEMSPQQRKAMGWVMRSMDEMVVHDNIGGQGTYTAAGTLFSGWRLTTFMNSVLNAVYSEEIYEPTEARHPMRSVHNGDDIILGMYNAQQAQKMLCNAIRLNVRAQPTKCAFGAVAEFLRVDRKAAGGGQYLARAVATLIHSRIESGPAMSLLDAIRSNETRLSEYVERGGELDTAIKLRGAYTRRVAPLYGNTADEAITMLEASSVVGGLSMHREAPIEWTVTETTVSENDEKQIMSLKGNRAWRGIADMANEILTKVSPHLGGRVKLGDITKRVYNSTLRALAVSRRRAIISATHDVARARNWREHRGTFKTLRASGTLGLARLAGVTIDINRPSDGELELLLLKAGQSISPMSFISIAT